MALEIANKISELVETNPLGTDSMGQGDDHIRLIKKVLKNTFPSDTTIVTVPYMTNVGNVTDAKAAINLPLQDGNLVISFSLDQADAGGVSMFEVVLATSYVGTPDNFIDYSIANGVVAKRLEPFTKISIKDYVSDPLDINAPLTQLCRIARVIDFAGMTLDCIGDFSMPLDSRCVRWDFSGATVNFKSSVCYLGKFKNFVIDLQGGTILLGAKKALLTINSTAGGNVFTVDSTADFVVGDILNSSFSPSYMPDSTTRIGTLGEFNTITALTATTITVKHNVPEVIPANSWVMSNRFDKRGITTDGSGTLVIKNGSIKEGGAGYFVGIYDSTQQARFYSENVDYDGAGLDMFNMEVHDATWIGGSFGRNYTIAKQGIVADHHPDGCITMKRVFVRKYNHDVLIFSNLSYATVGDFHLIDCVIDGINDRVFSGSARDYTDGNSLHVFAFPGDGNGLIPKIGNVLIEGGSIKNVARSVFGTTFATKTTFSYKSFTMRNVQPCQSDPIYISVTDYVNSSLGDCLFENCDFTCGLSVLNEGIPIDNTGGIVYRNCKIKPSSALISISTFTIVRSVLENCEILQGDAGEFYKVLGDSSEFKDVRLNKKVNTAGGQLSFIEEYSQSAGNSLILLGNPIRQSGFLNTADWFNGVDNKKPSIKFSLPGVGTRFLYGNPDSSIASQYRLEFQADRWNTPPYLTRGYTTLYVPLNSLIKGNDATIGKVTLIMSSTVNLAAIAGDTTVTLANVNNYVAGSIIGFLDLNTPSDFVRWYKVASISGYILTLSTPLISALAVGDPARGYNVINVQ